jgi:hypothetical protein
MTQMTLMMNSTHATVILSRAKDPSGRRKTVLSRGSFARLRMTLRKYYLKF